MTYISAANRLVLGRIALIRASGQDGALLVVIEPEEEGHRVAVLGGVVEDAVHGRLEPVVGQPLEKVANVDDERAGDWRHLDPLAVLREDLQAADAVLPEEREALQVGVGSEADVDGGVLGLGVLGVVVADAVTMNCSARRCPMSNGLRFT